MSIAKLRIYLHIIDKQQQQQECDDSLYSRLKKTVPLYLQYRNQLSSDEDNWCRSILFAEERHISPPISRRIYDNKIVPAIYERRSVRKWDDKPVAKSDCVMLADAMRWAPSSCNRQAMEMLVVRSKDKILQLSQQKSQKFIEKASTCIITLLDKSAYKNTKNNALRTYFYYMDSGMAIQNLLLQAHQSGIGACMVNVIPDVDEVKIRAWFKIPDNYLITGIIPIGYYSHSVNAPARKSIEGVVHYEDWVADSSSHSE
jgi:nitroreductase